MPGKKITGVYASYDDKNGPFGTAVKISKERGCVSWFDRSTKFDPDKVHCPAKIVIWNKHEKKYYRGCLLALARKNALPPRFVEFEGNHRPETWRTYDPQVVLFISHLKVEPKRPPEVSRDSKPQGLRYIWE